jgi:eukaryotic-like serine/threonine-protein kinase
MTPERHQQIVELFHLAFEQEPEGRLDFLERVCHADRELQCEVETMLAADQQSDHCLDRPPEDIAAQSFAPAHTRSLAGQVLGDYQVIVHLGTGGMGDVFLAQDTRLGRKAALKLLPENYTCDPAWLRRFEREACALSALNHPNIVTVYGLGRVGSVNFLATEFVEGNTLREELAKGPLSPRSVVEIAMQAALALGAAHQNGIIHRDIKPENIILRPDGLVKVLDFGLAKWTGEKLAGVDALQDLPECKTAPGLILGTPRYMSPEQARGLSVDSRSDLFTFGAVLYEMLAGRPAMDGDTPSDILAGVLTRNPVPLERLRPDCPAGLARIINQALEKDRDKRYQSADEMFADLKSLQPEIDKHLLFPATIRRHYRLVFAALTALIFVGILALYPFRSRGGSIDSIAVLPFSSEGGADLEFLADGLTDTLIGDLSQVPGLRVISRSSVFRFKGQQVDPAQTGTLLKAQSVLLGRVSQQGDRLLVRLELVDVHDNHRIWGEQYNRVGGDLAQMQMDISRETLDKLRITLTTQAQRQVLQRHRVTSEAYQLYLKGRSFLLGGTQSDLDAAVGYFHRALAKEPNYTLASVGLANAYVGLADYVSPREAMPKAREYALKAIGLGGAPGEAHVALGLVKLLYDWDWRGAEQEFGQNATSNPNTVETFSCYLHYQDTLGQTNQAAAKLAELLARDPMSPWANHELGCVSYYARRYDVSIDQFRRSIKLSPDFQIAYANAGRAFAQKGMYREAINTLEKGRKIDPSWPMTVAELGYAHAVSGQGAVSKDYLRQLNKIASHRYVDAFLFALIYVGLGDRERTVQYLEKAYAERSSSMPWLRVEPRLDFLRSDPRFKDLLRRVGFAG